MARKKANNRMLVILLALIAVVCVALWYADKVEREGKAAAAAEQPADEAAEALAELDQEVAVDVLENLDPDEAAQIIAEMSPDDAADVLDELEEGHRDVLLSNLGTLRLVQRAG